MERLIRIAVAAAVVFASAACAIPSQTTRVAGGAEPVTVRLRPALPSWGESAELTIESPSADSIVFMSENGLDRYSSDSSTLRIRVSSSLGDSVPVNRYAVRWNGELLSRLVKPTLIQVCRQGSCREYYHEIPVKLPEANHRTFALAAGYSTVFARRSLTGSRRTVLFQDALSSGIWSAQAEWAASAWNARVQGYAGPGDRGAALDLSRVVKHSGDVSYGVALHVDADRSEWLPQAQVPVITGRTTWRAGVGPSLMLRGVMATTQIGLYSDGVQTMQVVSTRVRVNGNLTEVRLPVSISAEKTFAFGGGEIVSRRRDALERLTASVYVMESFALNIGLAAHRSAWPNQQPSDDLRASETLFTLGGQYTMSW
jgi:hypothetical protein